METLIAIAMLALSLFGPGWSSEGAMEPPQHETGFIPPQPQLCTIVGVFDGETIEYFAFCHSP